MFGYLRAGARFDSKIPFPPPVKLYTLERERERERERESLHNVLKLKPEFLSLLCFDDEFPLSFSDPFSSILICWEGALWFLFLVLTFTTCLLWSWLLVFERESKAWEDLEEGEVEDDVKKAWSEVEAGFFEEKDSECIFWGRKEGSFPPPLLLIPETCGEALPLGKYFSLI